MDTKDIKEHYNRAARNRAERLKSPKFNVSQFNHTLRRRLLRHYFSTVTPCPKGIDMGTGTGVWAEELTDFCDEVKGLDFAEENIRIASANAQARGLDGKLSYELGDAQRLEGIPDAHYDLAVQISVLQHLPSKQECVARIHAILKEGGTLVMLAHNRACIYNHNLRSQRKRGGQVSVNEYSTVSDLHALLREAGFRVVETRLTWLFVNDLLFLGMGRPALKPLVPVRRLAASLLSVADSLLGRFMICTPLFREIVVIARKEP